MAKDDFSNSNYDQSENTGYDELAAQQKVFIGRCVMCHPGVHIQSAFSIFSKYRIVL